ncbi:MAG: phosphohydrolase [Acidobacteria bacterium]|nr:MAG: phosphohydrolase [Acidobacteriota bacterium]
MTDREKPEFMKLLMSTADLHGKELSTDVVELWWNSLKAFDLNQVRQAFSDHIQDPVKGEWMPKPANIIAKLEGSPERSALLAWTEVEEAVSSVGRYETVQFTDPVINATIRALGGWISLCDQNLDEPWMQKEFERRYLAYSEVGAGLNEPLPGLLQIQNKGHRGDPKMIGSNCGQQVRMIGDPGVGFLPLPEDRTEEVLKKLSEKVTIEE